MARADSHSIDKDAIELQAFVNTNPQFVSVIASLEAETGGTVTEAEFEDDMGDGTTHVEFEVLMADGTYQDYIFSTAVGSVTLEADDDKNDDDDDKAEDATSGN